MGMVLSASASAQTAHFSGAVSTLGSGFNQPWSVAVDASGNVYVADTNYGLVKEIVAVGGRIPATPTIRTLGSGFSSPYGVAVDGSGDVFVADTGHNTVKEMVAVGGSVPASPTINTLGSGFSEPTGVAVDGSGNVFVADLGNKAVKEILAVGGSVPASPTINTLGTFNIPQGVAVDGSGNVFVADLTSSGIWEILAVGGSIPASPTIVTVGRGFSSPYGVNVDGSGNVFVADSGNNAVKEIVAVGGSIPASPTILALGSGFYFPGDVAVDANGNVFVADGGHSVVKEIMIGAADFGSVAVGTATPPALTLNFTFDTAGTLGSVPSVLTQGAANLDFTDAGTGTCTANGTSHSYVVGETCTLIVKFSPTAPGQRLGAAELTNSSGAVIATAYVYGTGTAPLALFSSPVGQSLAGAGFSRPYDMFVCGQGIAYVADQGPNTISKVDLANSTKSLLLSLGTEPTGIAVDGAGNIFVSEGQLGLVVEYVGGAGSPVTIASGLGFVNIGLNVDGAGNLYAPDTSTNTVIKIAAGTHAQTSYGTGLNHPIGVSIDATGNLYISDNQNNRIVKVTADGATQTTVATISQPGRSAFDAAGNLYVAHQSSTIAKFAAGTFAETDLGSGFQNPYSLGLDASGNIFVSDYGTGSIIEINRKAAQPLAFPSTNVGSTSSAQTVMIENDGDANLDFAVPASGGNPSISAGFTIGNTSTCPQLTSGSSAGTLAPGAMCTDLVSFAPVAAGSITGSMTTTDNSLNAASTQSVSLSGTGLQAPQTITFPQPTTPVYYFAGEMVTLAATASSGLPITYTVTGPATLNGNVLTFTGGGTVVVTASQAGNANYSAATPVQVSIVVITVPSPYVSPSNIDFGAEPVGSTSNFWTVTLNNESGSPLAIHSIGVSDAVNFKETNNCPATLPAYTNCNVQVSFTPSATGNFGGYLQFNDDGMNAPQSVSLAGVGTSNAPTATFAPSSINFGTQNVGTLSNPWTVTLSNTSGYPLPITSAVLSDTTDFSQTNNCGAALAAYTTCTFQVAFTPSTAGTITGTLTITDNAIGSPQVVSLTGAGVANMPVVVLAPTSIDFGSQPVGTTSNTWTVTVNNTSSLPATFSSPIAATGPFTETNNCGATLAAHSTCNVLVAFAPVASGAANGTLTVAINGGYVVPPVPLTGIGTSSAPVLFFAPTNIDFGGQVVNTTSNAWTITLNNPSGTAATFPGPISVSGAFSQTNNCGLSLAAYSTCTVQVAFAPTAAGAATGQLLVLVNGSTSATVSLTGMGLAATPVVVFAPGSVDFGSQAVGTASNPWTVTLNNISDFPAPFSSPMGIVGSSDFSQTNNCGTSLAAHSTCNVLVTFAPTSTGGIYGQLEVLIGGSSTPVTASLTGTGAPATQAVFFSPSSIDFGGQTVGTASNPWTLTLNNTSGTAATITSPIRIVGAGFSQSNNCGASLAAYSTCNVLVTFTPNSTGAISAQLAAAVNGGDAPSPVSLTGTGVAAAQVVLFSPTNINFGSQTVGTTSNPWTVTLSNESGTVANFSSPITLSGDTAFSQTNNCGTSLAAYSTCNVQVAFTPSSPSTFNGQMVVMVNGSSAPLAVGLTGTGASATPLLVFSPTSIDFGSQAVGTTSNAWTVTLNNESGTAATFTSPVVALGDPAFAQTNNCGTSLAAHTTCTVQVTFAPLATGTLAGQIRVLTSGAGSTPYTVSLTGTGTPAITPVLFFSPSSIDFGNQLVGTSNSWTLTLNNTTSANATFASPVMVLGDPSFTESDNCGGGLAAHSTCTVRATFAPTATGTVAAQLSVVTSGAGGAPYIVGMTGTGTVPPDYSLSVNPSSLTLTAGQTGVATFTFTPVGGFAGTVNFTCTGLPAGAACIFAPPSVTANGSNTVQISQLTVTTTGPNGGTVTIGQNSTRTGPTLAALFFFPGMAFGGLLAWRRKALPARMRRLLLVLLMASVVGAVTGCAVLPKLTPTGTNLVTVVSTASGSTTSGTSVSHSASFTLTINQ